MTGLEMLKRGEFNHMGLERETTEIVKITLVKRGEGKIYRFRVKDLYGEHEEVLEEEIAS